MKKGQADMQGMAYVVNAFREHGMAAGFTALATVLVGVAVAAARKAFTNDAVLHRLEQELAREREAERIREAERERRREEDRKAINDRLQRMETQIGTLYKHLIRENGQ